MFAAHFHLLGRDMAVCTPSAVAASNSNSPKPLFVEYIIFPIADFGNRTKLWHHCAFRTQVTNTQVLFASEHSTYAIILP
jgi:hypothetical protein